MTLLRRAEISIPKKVSAATVRQSFPEALAEGIRRTYLVDVAVLSRMMKEFRRVRKCVFCLNCQNSVNLCD